MAKRIKKTTPKQDGFRMPGEYEPQEKVWMIWPERPDNWRDGGKPAQEAFTEVAKAISRFTPMNVVVSQQQFQNCRRQLPEDITVYEMSNNDAWIRDCGPSFVINDKGELRANDWGFNAWGGLVDGLYFPWDQDDLGNHVTIWDHVYLIHLSKHSNKPEYIYVIEDGLIDALEEYDRDNLIDISYYGPGKKYIAEMEAEFDE